MSFAKGRPLPISTLARIERGELDPGVTRLHQLLRLYRIPPHLVLDLMDLEELAVEPPTTSDVKTIYEAGIRHWERGDTAQGLAHLFALREHIPAGPEAALLRQKATLAFAVYTRNLGKFELALQVVGDLLREPPDISLRLNTLVLAADVWRGLGSLDSALAYQQQAETYLELGNLQQAAWVSHQKGRLLSAAGRLEEGESALRSALASYRSIPDLFGELKARLALVDIFVAQRRYSHARQSAGRIVREADARAHAGVALSAMIKLGAIDLAEEKVDDAVAQLADGLSRAMRLKHWFGQFLAHYYLWKAYGRMGDPDRARLALESAQHFVRFVDEASPEADEVRNLPTTGGMHDRAPDPPPDGT